MILITGTSLDASQLPNADVMDYQIDNERMDIKLKTIAKSPNCFSIYISEDKKSEYTVTDELLSKIVYFSDDKTLIKLLEKGITADKDPFEDDDTDNSVEEVDVPVFDPPKPIETVVEVEPKEEKKSNSKKPSANLNKDVEVKQTPTETITNFELTIGEDSVIPKVDIIEANTELPEEFLKIPNIGEDIDSLRVQLENKDRQIAQKDGTIEELKRDIDEIYKTQELQLKEVEDSFKKKISEFQETIHNLESKLAKGSLDEQATQFLRFIHYANSYKGVSREEFSDAEKTKMGKLTSNFHIFATAGGESTKSMFAQIKELINKGTKSLIIDFTNDVTLSAMLKLGQNTHSMTLNNDEVNPVTLLKDVNGCNYIPTTSFNDIAFLTMDWAKIINKINTLAGGKDVILLFGDINNFNVRTTISKLATIGTLQVFVKCNPIIFTEFYLEISFIPKERVNIVALDYIDVVKSILSSIANTYNVQAFQGKVDWKKLNIK